MTYFLICLTTCLNANQIAEYAPSFSVDVRENVVRLIARVVSWVRRAICGGGW